MVMAQTLFMRLKHRNPAVIIDVLAPEWSRPLLERMPEINQPISLPIGHGSLALAQRRRIGLALRTQRYDQAIVLPNSWKSALIPWWANIPQRTGWCGEARWGLLNDIRQLDKAKYPLMVERFMALAQESAAILPKPYPQPYFHVAPVDVAIARTKYALDNTTGKILALCPGAEFGPAKRWPDAHYAVVANKWLDEGGQVWLFGSKNDFTVCEQIKSATQGRCINLAGQTTLGEAIDLLSESSAVVSNDSGLMHIAAALNKPLVAVYGSSDPRFTPPQADQVRVERLGLSCSPCFKRECPLQHLDCLNKLEPARVITALDAMVTL
jgi:heptosyltransferase-2